MFPQVHRGLRAPPPRGRGPLRPCCLLCLHVEDLIQGLNSDDIYLQKESVLKDNKVKYSVFTRHIRVK